jgi:endonuclease/exonuclease/phosphatase (EEP) superfamily protein YafD
MKTALQILAVVLAVGTLMPYLRCDHWTVRGWDFPRLQIFLAAALTLLGLLLAGIGDFWWDGVVIGILVLTIIRSAVWMWPYTRLAGYQVQPAEQPSALKVLMSNVLMQNRRSDPLLAVIRKCKPDLLVAVETDQWWCDELAKLADDFPHAVEVPQDDTYGMVVRSRIPLIDAQVKHLVRANIPSVHAWIKLRSGQRVRLYAVHPKPPFPDEASDSSSRDAELLIVGRMVEETGCPCVVLGDLNDVAWSRTTKLFQRISKLLDPRIGRGFFSTYHAGHWWMRWPLDHVFFSDHFKLRKMERLPHIGSDHFPIHADLSFEPSDRDEQEPPAKEESDDEKTDEEIAAAHDG